MKIYGISLAAGYGSRLLPLTGKLPKPLLPLCGKPIIEYVLENLFNAGADKIAVNTHHLGYLIEEYLRKSCYAERIVIFPEPEILGTGGPFVNAKDFLCEADLILLQNADIISDFDLRPLIEKHCSESNIATMALIEGPENRVLCSGGKVRDILGKLSYPSNEATELLTYSCVMALSPEIFAYLPENPEFCSIIDAVLAALKEHPECIGAYCPRTPFTWTDVGSFQQYFEAHRKRLEKDDGVHIGKNCNTGSDVLLSGFVSIGDNCVIGNRASLSNCILLDGATVSPGEHRAWEIIGDDFSCHRDTREISALEIVLEFMPEIRIRSLAEQGSNRRFLRLSAEAAPSDSKILMLSSESDADFERFIQIGEFFNSNNLRTPTLYKYDMLKYAVLMEDLGDATIFETAVSCDNSDDLEALYRRVIDASVDFQLRGTEILNKSSFALRDFDYDYLRWETNYFMKHFLRKLCALRLTKEEESELDMEFHELAISNRNMTKMLMHRDFQSQNILLHKNEIRFVDYQGARIGPYAYDIMSLLKDPYFRLDASMRERLASYHCEVLNASGFTIAPEHHRRDCAISALQRNMQCLGAYGYLSLVMGKKKYLKFAPLCLNYLMDSLKSASEFPHMNLALLNRLVQQAKDNLPDGIEKAQSKEI